MRRLSICTSWLCSSRSLACGMRCEPCSAALTFILITLINAFEDAKAVARPPWACSNRACWVCVGRMASQCVEYQHTGHIIK